MWPYKSNSCLNIFFLICLLQFNYTYLSHRRNLVLFDWDHPSFPSQDWTKMWNTDRFQISEVWNNHCNWEWSAKEIRNFTQSYGKRWRFFHSEITKQWVITQWFNFAIPRSHYDVRGSLLLLFGRPQASSHMVSPDSPVFHHCTQFCCCQISRILP